MKLVVLLGNPGKQYQKTRHNVGWLFGDYLRDVPSFPEFRFQKQWGASYLETMFAGAKLLLIKPETFMNRSGDPVQKIMQYFKIPKEDIIIIYDDKDLAFGEVRFRQSGSSGGHKGIQHIIEQLGSEDIARIKIGVDHPQRTEHRIDTADYVLSDFSSVELGALRETVFPFVLEKLDLWFHQQA